MSENEKTLPYKGSVKCGHPYKVGDKYIHCDAPATCKTPLGYYCSGHQPYAIIAFGIDCIGLPEEPESLVLLPHPRETSDE